MYTNLKLEEHTTGKVFCSNPYYYVVSTLFEFRSKHFFDLQFKLKVETVVIKKHKIDTIKVTNLLVLSFWFGPRSQN